MNKEYSRFIDDLYRRHVGKSNVTYKMVDKSNYLRTDIADFAKKVGVDETKVSVEALSDFILLQAYNDKDEHFIGVTTLLDGENQKMTFFQSKYNITDREIASDGDSITLVCNTQYGDEMAYFIYKDPIIGEITIIDRQFFLELPQTYPEDVRDDLEIFAITKMVKPDKNDTSIFAEVGIKLMDTTYTNVYKINLNNDKLDVMDIGFRIVEKIPEWKDKLDFLEKAELAISGPIRVDKLLLNDMVSNNKLVIDLNTMDIVATLTEDQIVHHAYSDIMIIGDMKLNKFGYLEYGSAEEISNEVTYFATMDAIVYIGGTESFCLIEILNETMIFHTTVYTWNKDNREFDKEVYDLKSVPNKMYIAPDLGRITMAYHQKLYNHSLTYMLFKEGLYKYSRVDAIAMEDDVDKYVTILKQHLENHILNEVELEDTSTLYHLHKSALVNSNRILDKDPISGEERYIVKLSSSHLVNLTKNHSEDDHIPSLTISPYGRFIFVNTEDKGQPNMDNARVLFVEQIHIDDNYERDFVESIK